MAALPIQVVLPNSLQPYRLSPYGPVAGGGFWNSEGYSSGCQKGSTRCYTISWWDGRRDQESDSVAFD